MTPSPPSDPEPPPAGRSAGPPDDAAPPDGGAAARRALGATLLGGALGAAVVLVAAGRTWAEAVAVGGGARLPVTVQGGDVSGLPSALALVGLAALVAVFAVRGRARRLVGALLAACGAGTVAAALVGAADTAALRTAGAEATGLTGGSLADVSHSAWPYVAAAGGLLLLLAGLLALRYAGHWPAMGSRYERAGARPAARRAAPADPDRPEDLWKALDRGEDPTGAPPPPRSAAGRNAAQEAAGDERPEGS
ncbi:TIGR02234 family membrane protein [Streptomyces sp. TRM70308]|uniref:TIGR02234 family membrane protein n=1 Tax=Streptomyces sp. TRM70308 TaxID=3131932 RepID=UPI003CFE9BCC